MTLAIDKKTWRSPNYDNRPAGTDIWAIVVHSCEGSPASNEQNSSLPWLCNPSSGVSCHYYVTREAMIYELVDPAKRAWHAGESVLNGVWYANNYSIGIEMEHRQGAAMYPQIQIDALSWLCRGLIAAYAIPRNGVTTHRAVAQPAGRKIDPTDISDTDFTLWANALYVTDPLQARTIAGPPGAVPRYCSIPVYEFYAARGGLAYCGYPLLDEYRTTFGSDNRPCAVLLCERVIIKESPQYGVEQSLLSEARTEGWLQ